jgi:hypothetical protein
MSHFAKVENGIVTEVIVAEQDFINSGSVGDAFLWVQTSYNGSFRKNYAAVGFSYDKVEDVFISPQPFPSWTLDTSDYNWICPVDKPNDTKSYNWNENTLAWDEVVYE